MNLQIKFLGIAIVLAVIAMWLEGCNFAVVESTPVEITWAATAQAEENDVSYGSRDSAGETRVKEIQARLVELGYLEEAPDGVFGKNTEGALIHFQELNGLEPTGVADRTTMYRLESPKAAAAPGPEPVHCAVGSEGDQVRRIQELLGQYGFNANQPDGGFGKKTQESVQAFQDYLLKHYGTDFGAGETATDGTERAGYGEVSVEMYRYMDSGQFPVYRADAAPGDDGEEVARIQNRLAALGYLYDYEPGVFDRFTEEAVYWFQGRNSIRKTGIADAYTQKKLFGASAIGPDTAEHPYFMRVSRDEQRVYIYRWVCGGYNQLIKTMICSTGKAGWETPTGLFHSSGHAGDQWHYFEMSDCYAQYGFNINGNILFHSVLYWEDDETTLQKDTLDALGTPASHGCVRLTPEDAYWIYWNNKPGAPIEVY